MKTFCAVISALFFLTLFSLKAQTPPSKPTNLAGDSITIKSVYLSWNPSSDDIEVTGYIIYNGTDSINTTSDTSFKVINLAPSTSYSFSIKAYDNEGTKSDTSNTLTIKTLTDTDKPTTPSALTSSNITSSSVHLSWGTSTDNYKVTGYIVYEDTDSIGFINALSYDVTGLSATTVYSFTVKATDAAGNKSDASNSVEVTTTSAPDTQAPTMPTNLSSSNITGTSVHLNWNASTDNIEVTGYIIYRNSDSVSTVTTLSYDVTGLTSATTYSFTIKAIDAAGNKSAASTAKSVTTIDITVPSTPTYLALSNVTSNSIHLSWTGSTDNVGVTYYIIYRSNDSIAYSATTSYDLTGLTPLTTYSFKIKAKDAAGNYSAASSSKSTTTLADTESPSAPTSLNSNNITTSGVNLTWSASTDNIGVTGYNIYSGTTLVTTVTTLTYNVTGLTPATTYSFTIKAKDAAGNLSTASAAKSVTTLADTENPTTPTNLSSSNITATGVRLTWGTSTDNIAVTGYNIYQGANLLTTVTTLTYDVTGLTSGTTYSFTAKAKDAAGNLSAASNTVSVTTSDNVAPSAPTNLKSSNLTAASLTLTWSASTDNVGVTGYNIYQGSTLVTTVTALTYNVTGLTSATAYSFTVKARDAIGNLSVASNIVSITTPDNVGPTTPLDLKSTKITSNSIQLAWLASTDNVGVTGYIIYRGTDSIATITGLAYEVPGLTSATNYTFSVKAKDAAGNKSASSNTLIVMTLDITAPTAPTNLVSSEITIKTAKLSWTASTDNIGVTTYIIYNGSDSIATSTSNQTTVTGLTPSKDYSLSVKATDAAGNKSTSSNVVTFTTPGEPDVTGPTAPGNIADKEITDSSFSISWSLSTDNIEVTGYHIYLNDTIIGSTKSLEYLISGLKDLTQYKVYVKAYDAAENVSDTSNVLVITTLKKPDLTAPSTPEDVTLCNYSSEMLSFTWSASTDNEELAGYQIFVNNKLIATIEGTEFSLIGLFPNVTYIFYVIAIDKSGNVSPASRKIAASSNGQIILDINDKSLNTPKLLLLDFGMKQLFVNIPNINGTIEKAEIYDINGRLIINSSSIDNNTRIYFGDLSLKQGPYILAVSVDGIRQTTKVLVK